MADKVTLSLNPDTLARARQAAKHDGLSLSAWIDRAARREAIRAAARRHEEWLAANPDVRDELDRFDRYADNVDAGWSDLAGAA
ncbi:hypothetical protein [Plantactinospora soyae]|uniref:Uncharacterized protein YigA (DUF484 family) n=1 Tax=Plantactinospora soyae TaxID=1544732 RepID=A0A927R1J3_9ACTN|nr:hypothetical protein [Plantactinospora soyae]MBE1491447.1 uncharacterized protein YigA (DUF484 family) [Plantactinospora soyae]